MLRPQPRPARRAVPGGADLGLLQEEGGLVQALNHILARFQNRRVMRGRDPLARFDLNPLRPLRQILWSWVEDEVAG